MKPLLSLLKTTLGFFATLVTRYTPLDLSTSSLEGIFNFVRVSDTLLTSGQPTEAQFEFVRAAGVEVVINLAPHGVENSLADEASVVHALGMEYVHIPVNFKRPSDAHFDRFCEVMERVGDTPTLVHCAANARVSAFVFRYRRDRLGEDPALLERDLHQIWVPYGPWKPFIAPRPPVDQDLDGP